MTGPVGDIVMSASTVPTLNNIALPIDSATADVAMLEAEPRATTGEAQNIVLFMRRSTNSDTMPVYIRAGASVEELEALLQQSYCIHPSKHVLLVGDAPLLRDATLASQGIRDRMVIVLQATSAR